MKRLLDIYSKYRRERDEILREKTLFNSEVIFQNAFARLRAQKQNRDESAWNVFNVNGLKSDLKRKKQEYYSVRRKQDLTPQEENEWEQSIADIAEKCNEKIQVNNKNFFAARKKAREEQIAYFEYLEEQQRKTNADFEKKLMSLKERLRKEEAEIIETLRRENAEKGGES